MSSFWVYCNPARGRLLMHASGCPACEGDKPFLLDAAARRQASGVWEEARSYAEAVEVATALATNSSGLQLTTCAICSPTDGSPQARRRSNALADRGEKPVA